MLILPLSQITQFCNPFESVVWRGLQTPILLSEIDDAIESNAYQDANKPYSKMFISRKEHIKRIAYLVINKQTDPIEIETEANWLVNDGNHRLAAAIYRNDETINVAFYGVLEKIEYLFGGEIAKQVEELWDLENQKTAGV